MYADDETDICQERNRRHQCCNEWNGRNRCGFVSDVTDVTEETNVSDEKDKTDNSNVTDVVDLTDDVYNISNKTDK